MMKWIAISGSWRHTSPEIEQDVRRAVRDIVVRGDGIITGGALNVDFFATDEAMRADSTASQIKVFIPVTLERYATHYRNRAEEGVVTHKQAEELILQLTKLKQANTGALIENPENTVLDQITYFDRNTDIVEASDELIAFQVNQSMGTQDAIDKARKRGKHVLIHAYTMTS